MAVSVSPIILFLISMIIILFILYRSNRRHKKNRDRKREEKEEEYFVDKNIKKLKLGPFLTGNEDITNITHGMINVDQPVKKIQSSAQRLYVYNPSIAYDNNGDIVGVSRMTGKIAKECTYYKDSDFQRDDQVDREMVQYKPKFSNDLSTVVMWKLRDLPNFTVIPMFSAEKICDNNEFLETSQGVEDPRLFRFRGQLWIYAHYRGSLSNECTHAPVIIPADEPYDYRRMIKLSTSNMKWIEKNWMPFEYNGELYFVYDISPHIILKCDLSTGYCREVYRTDNIAYDPIAQKHLGGGAPAVKFMLRDKPYFITIAHTRENKPHIVRKNFFYIFRAEPPFDIVMVGSEFDVMEDYRLIEFGSGLLLSKDAKKVIISAGISDCYSVMCEYDLVDVLSTLRHVGEM